MKIRQPPLKRVSTKLNSVAGHRCTARVVNEHMRLKQGGVNAVLMDLAVAQLAEGKGVLWNPFKS